MKEIVLSGVFGWDITPDLVRSALADANGGDIEVIIASVGGSVWDGFDIYNQISNYKRKNPSAQMMARMSSIVASMAAYIAMNPSFDLVTAEDNAAFMIHNAWSISIGDFHVMRKDASMLEGISAPTQKLVSDKMGISDSEAAKLMKDETWFFGKQIVDAGFADEIVERPVGGTDHNEASASAEMKRIQSEIVRKVYAKKMIAASAHVVTEMSIGATYSDSIKIIDQTWDKAQADRRWREHTGATEAPNSSYSKAFLWYDSENSENFTVYKLQIKDYVDGQDVVNIRAVNNADARLNQTQGPTAAEKERIQSILNRYQERWRRQNENNSSQSKEDKMKEEEIRADGERLERERVKELMEIKQKYEKTPSAAAIAEIVDKAIVGGGSKSEVLTDIQVMVASGNTQAAIESPGSLQQGYSTTVSGETGNVNHANQFGGDK